MGLLHLFFRYGSFPLHLLCLLVPLLASCTHQSEQQIRYQEAQQTARQRPVSPTIAVGLHLGMPEAEVIRRLDSLRRHDALIWPLRTGNLPLEAEPEFVQGQLVQLSLILKGRGDPTAADFHELVRSLRQAYGKAYLHGLPGEEDQDQSWFTGGTEVNLSVFPGEGYFLHFIALPHAHALTLQHLRRDSLQLVQMERERREWKRRYQER